MKKPTIAQNKFIIRKLEAPDAASYRELRLEGLKIDPSAFGASWEEEERHPLSWHEERLKSSFIYGGFTHNKSLVGVSGFYVPTPVKQSHKAVLWGMFITPKHRGFGLSKGLIAEVIKEAKSRVEEITLTVVDTNIPAVQLYKGLGFKEYGLDRHALKLEGGYFDELLMSLSLHKHD